MLSPMQNVTHEMHTVREFALAKGLRSVHFAPLQAVVQQDAFKEWLDAGYHGDLEWMKEGIGPRLDPRLRLKTAQSVAVFSIFHHHIRPPAPSGRVGKVARYAWGRDYHNLFGKRLRRLQKALRHVGINSWGGVDTAPILEREWARQAGLGFTGKNTMQILPGKTSYFFLGVLFFPFQVPPVHPLKDFCGRCNRCLTACPTQAFPAPHVLDATRCISYWTIEAKTLPPEDLRESFGQWIFGCDVCQEVCPHNHNPLPGEEDDFLPRNAWLDLDALILKPDEALEDSFIGTPIRRAKATGLKRNALIALGNLGDAEAIGTARFALKHNAPVVRGAAVWCLKQLGGHIYIPETDTSPLVQKEIVASKRQL